ncbi:hypothetical protein [Rhizobium leguminosarum]|uniref:hypothetical protein n=1 Tax=Rhizobium leguminosarum TaxID=384 RepID=UPI003F9472D5
MQFLTGALCYIRSAQLLRESDEWEIEGKRLIRPTLHLLAHGLELFLKFPLLVSGKNLEELAFKPYGHNLRFLWDHADNALLRDVVLHQAEISWNQARDSGRWPKDEFNADPKRAFVAAVYKLSRLHSKESEYALRYVMFKTEKAPRSQFLLDVLFEVLDAAARRPDFVLDPTELSLMKGRV